MEGILISKAFKHLTIINENERKFKCWGALENMDKQGDIMGVEQVTNVMDGIMTLDGLIMYNHTSFRAGMILNWEPEEKDGVPGVTITGIIYVLYPTHDKIWQDMKDGIIVGLSFCGKGARKTTFGDEGNILDVHEGWEFSLTEDPANAEAEMIEMNVFAKSRCVNCPNRIEKDARPPKDWWDSCISEVSAGMPSYTPEQVKSVCGWRYHHHQEVGKSMETIEKKVERRGDKWCTVHCTGKDKGEVIACFDTKEKAEAQHRAIQARKSIGDALEVLSKSFHNFNNYFEAYNSLIKIGKSKEEATNIATYLYANEEVKDNDL